MFNAIEKIEVAVRARMVQVYSEATGNSHWFSDETLYKSVQKCQNLPSQSVADLKPPISRSPHDLMR